MKIIPVRRIQKPQESNSVSHGISIRNLKELVGQKDMVQDLHRHDFYFILILKKGKGEHEIDFVNYPVKNFSVYFIRPGQVHRLKLKKGSEGYLIQLSLEFYSSDHTQLKPLIRKASANNYYAFTPSSYRKIDLLLSGMLEENFKKQAGYHQVIQSSLTIFLIDLIRNNHLSMRRNENSYSQERLEELFHLLENHIVKHKQVVDYADMLHLSEYQLNKITKGLLNKTCSELINDFIVLETKRYLLASTYQISQIASYLGYEDVSYFIRFFKKQTRYTPDAYRKNFSKVPLN